MESRSNWWTLRNLWSSLLKKVNISFSSVTDMPENIIGHRMYTSTAAYIEIKQNIRGKPSKLLIRFDQTFLDAFERDLSGVVGWFSFLKSSSCFLGWSGKMTWTTLRWLKGMNRSFRTSCILCLEIRLTCRVVIFRQSWAREKSVTPSLSLCVYRKANDKNL